ncbi:polysaccharide deacetylase [Asticcacaulis sp. BYS171W]|uniref:Polysaccharide deacetylase n=1 Tax=Asticcacaulis aquaticus TaxID=2984212 RepID=A0ABT5HSM9_9CAUL|nr:polysaccharide deacetylase [Asticcacaulis aquaticus]MDC7683073.1 polysaccharide deacetylase [Asticcacaulis aquaticus]
MTLKHLTATACVLAMLASGTAAAERFDIAITVDDLPAHGPLPKGMTRDGIASSYLATLKANKVPEAYGFANPSKMTTEPGSGVVLDLWRNADYPLGNHTLTHMGLAKAPSLAAWLADLEAGEPEVAKRMDGWTWKVLRFPFLNATANDPARRAGAMAWLSEHGYAIAEVTVSFDDFAYTDAYARCLAKGDTATIKAMEVQYFKQVDDGIVRMKALSQKVYGRMIPQVLLTHLGGWSAHTMPVVMQKLDAAGARYVTLSQAQSDAAYREADPLRGNGPMMERAAKRKGIAIDEVIKPAPTANVKELCK